MATFEPMKLARDNSAAQFAQRELQYRTAYNEPHWYAAYTYAKHEIKVAEQLVRRSVEHFLPLYQSVRQWKDRKVRLKLPLFPGYIFVRLARRAHFQP